MTIDPRRVALSLGAGCVRLSKRAATTRHPRPRRYPPQGDSWPIVRASTSWTTCARSFDPAGRPVHASITYMAYAPEWWYVLDPDRSIGLDDARPPGRRARTCRRCSSSPATSPCPRSRGAGRAGSSARSSSGSAVPWVFGVVVLAPLITYMIYVSRGIRWATCEFWTTDFWGPMFQQAVYWFLGVLSPVPRSWPGVRTRPARACRPACRASSSRRPRAVRGFVAADGGGSALFSPAFGLDDWQAVRVVPRRPAGPDRVLRRATSSSASTRSAAAG